MTNRVPRWPVDLPSSKIASMTTPSPTPSIALAPTVLRNRTAALVVAMFGFAALTAVLAQFRIMLPGTPVPLTGQTFAVLLSGAALGARWGAGSQVLYIAAGMVGMPVFASGNGGWEYATGATLGYLVGFVVAAAAVGYMADRRQDRQVPSALAAFLVGSLIIYVFGVGWLVVGVGMGVGDAVLAGFWQPFLVGDVLKVGLAGTLVPTIWRMIPESGD